MPQIANQIVKKADGVTDVTFVAKQGQGGPETWALWRQDAVATIDAHCPTLEHRSRYNGNKTMQRSELVTRFPYPQNTGGTGSVLEVKHTHAAQTTFAQAVNADRSAFAEVVDQHINALVAFRATLKVNGQFT